MSRLTNQRIGKKIKTPASHAPAVEISLRRVVTIRAMTLRLQILADDTDEKECDDVGDDDRDEAAGRGAADVVLDQRLRIDQEGDVGGLQARTASGGDEDIGEHREQEDGLDRRGEGFEFGLEARQQAMMSEFSA
jgi:hypothetical protein